MEFDFYSRYPNLQRVRNKYLIPAGMGAKDCAQCVCLSVCPLAYLKKPHVQTSRNLLYVLAVTVVRTSSDDNAIRYVLPVLWMTSCFHITGHTWCTAKLTAEGCESAGGNTERGGAEALQLRPLYVACRHTQWSSAVEPNNALCTAAKCATLFPCLSFEAQNVLNFIHNYNVGQCPT